MGRLHPRQSNTDVPQCGSLQFSIPTSPQTTPPYSLIVYPASHSQSTVYPLTLTGQNVSWTVDYPRLSTLILNLVDSKGNPIGYPETYTVQNGSTSCLPPSPRPTDSPIVVVADTSTSPKTCSAITMYYSGGQTPYTATFLPMNGAAAYNITMGTNDDALSWVDTLPPSTEFYVVASDSQGVHSLPAFFRNYNSTVASNNTTGGTDIDCPGQVTRSFSSGGSTGNGNNSTATTTTTASDTNNTGGNSNVQNNGARTAAIVGGVVGAVLLLGLLFILFRRRINHGRGRYNKPGFKDIPESGLISHSATGGPMMHEADTISTPFLDPYYVNTSSQRGPTAVASESMDRAGRKMARVAQQSGDSTSHPMNSGQRNRAAPSAGSSLSDSDIVHEQVPEHQEASSVIELPPAYTDIPIH